MCPCLVEEFTVNKQELLIRLKDLKDKQARVDAKWKQTGNRELLSFFVELIPMALSVERCSIFIADPKSNNLWLQCGTGLTERSIKVPVDNSIVGEVISSGKVLVDEDLENRFGAHNTVSARTGFHPRDTLCVPIMGVATKKVCGVIQVLNKKTVSRSDVYTQEDIGVLQKLAFHLQMNIENIYLRQELGTVSQALAEKIRILERKYREVTGTAL